MEAKKEAERIVKMFYPYANYDRNEGVNENTLKHNAKECAKLKVEGIMNELKENITIRLMDESNLPNRVLYYQEVLKQIELI